ncbi:tetratricopeptide repeat protein [bacterium]|nr:tetratricopeptide repeat protein [bacterium]
MLGWLRKLFGAGKDDRGDRIPPEARALHEKGRALGGAGKYDEAIAVLEQAQALAPNWPHPTYDMAFSWLLKGDMERALAHYEKVEAMVPDHFFFTNQTAVWCLRGERDGRLAPGSFLAFSMIEWESDPAKKLDLARTIVAKCPDHSPTWLVIAQKASDPEERRTAMEKCLSLDADPITRDTARFIHANELVNAGRQEEAFKIIRALADAPDTVPSIKAFIQVQRA